ncbi:DUF459 domain-containing protein [Capillimicrobium parvum]|uniref:SGNH hydrolase-type esterase domain-containing protein n=1 Tax=Capillimicrobium parvum TaxID=2884022 RepID=A0A9E7C0X5_9ACTN|nr:hypothetical protein [Capillimicrobium parvum]UGS36885.1 hypothetical protein DSM104329_03296 [Capillimicrobium parvum]
MHRLRLLAIALLVAAPALAAAAAAQTPTTPLSADTVSENGWIALRITGPAGAQAAIGERVDGAIVPLTSVALAGGRAEVPRLAAWQCDRTLRRFVVTTPNPDGTLASADAAVRTPSCSRRMRLTVASSRVRTGGTITVRVEDAWHAGGASARVCARPPRGAGARCRVLRPSAAQPATASWRASSAGLWRIRLTTADGQRSDRTVRVSPPGRVRLLATGDSMIQIIDSDLSARLENAAVRSDARISTGISKPFMLDWVKLARRQAASSRPDVTVVFLGANDGFPIGDVACCGKPWIDAYAGRVRAMMRSYLRDGEGRVYWLLLPPPGKESFARVFRSVNGAIRLAARGQGPRVRLIDVGKVVAPGGHFRRTITYKGRTVVVRQDDQVHLSTAGAAIATDLIVAALRRDGLTR